MMAFQPDDTVIAAHKARRGKSEAMRANMSTGSLLIGCSAFISRAGRAQTPKMVLIKTSRALSKSLLDGLQSAFSLARR